MVSSTSSLRPPSLFAVDRKELSDSLPHFALSSYNSRSPRTWMHYALQIFHFLYCRHSSSSSLSYASSARSSCLTIQRVHMLIRTLYSKPCLNSGRTAAARRICRADAGFSPLFARSKKYGNLFANDSRISSGIRRCHCLFSSSQ